MPKGLPHREQVAAYLRVDDALGELRDAVEEGDLQAASRRLDDLQRAHERHAPDLSVAEAGERLGVTPPTIKSWGKKGLLEVLGTSPKTVSARSVVELDGKLDRLRDTASNKRQWAALLEGARDQEELDLPGAREGLKEALSARPQRTRSGKPARRSRARA
ncbi:MAG: hypothetical protein H0W36_14355 [Gemmatimonadetes bacterium]|nr:hypothetical protein [Gemmatimonadota bacterium]